MTMRGRATLFVLAAGATVVAIASAQPKETAKQPTAPVAAVPDAKPSANAALSVTDRLEASATLYREARTYRDEGTLTLVMDTNGRKVTDTKTFTTAFERHGRFYWQFRHSGIPGQILSHQYAIWSSDGDSFDSSWTLDNSHKQGQGLHTPLAGATGISGGAATAIVPLLHVSSERMRWGLMTTDLLEPSDAGKEVVDGVECWKIEGKARFGEAKVMLWLDDAGLIRKTYWEMVVDPVKLPPDAVRGHEVQKFTTFTTITIKGVINEDKIDDSYFGRDEKDVPAADGEPAALTDADIAKMDGATLTLEWVKRRVYLAKHPSLDADRKNRLNNEVIKLRERMP